MRNLAPALKYSIPTAERAQQALVPVSERIAALLKPVRTIPRYSDFGYDGQTEVWEPGQVTLSDVPELERQLALIDEAMEPSEPGALLARIHALLAQYREKDPLPPQVEAAIVQDWLDDLGEFPFWVIAEACKQWRRHPSKFRFKPMIGDILALCKENSVRQIVQRERLRKLLAAVTRQPMTRTERPDARVNDIRSRVIALAAAKRMP